jgi:hypothetical protein
MWKVEESKISPRKDWRRHQHDTKEKQHQACATYLGIRSVGPLKSCTYCFASPFDKGYANACLQTL